MKNIKVTFNGVFSPSGKRTGVPYMAGEARVEQWKKNKYFDMDIEMPKAPKPKKKAKKAKDKGDE